MANILKYHNLLKELDRYPNLKRAVEHFYDTDGEAEHIGKLPNLIVWIRVVMDELGYDAAEFFEMSKERADDFYSWGHNSRWSNTFYDFLTRHFDWCVGLCIDLADESKDFDVEEYMNKPKEDKND